MDFTGLNSAQQKAVLHGDAPLLVLAGAGTGKTTVITYRIAHLMKNRAVHAHQILAVTFTNKAAREMRERSARLADVPPERLDIGTFHGMCGRLLRRYGGLLGLDARFVIYDGDDQLQLMRQCMLDAGIDPQAIKPRAIRNRIEHWKNQGVGPEKAQPDDFRMLDRHALEIYKRYSKRCREANAVDFGDLLLHTLTLLRQHPDVLQQCRRRWSHILVDEYQDTNPVQYKLLRQLTSPVHSLTVVGDDDQSIYRWRGADIGNILRFERDFSGAHVIRLEHNYRSTQNVLKAANAVVSHNAARKGKTLFSEREAGERIALRVFATERDEGEGVAQEVAGLLRRDVDPSEIAILYRTNAQSRPFEESLRRRSIPYAIYGGIRFYDRREIKDSLAYLRLLVNPRSEIDFVRIINVPPRGIGKTSIARLRDLAQERDSSLLDAACAVVAGAGKFSGKPKKGLTNFATLLDWAESNVGNIAPGRILEGILQRSGYLARLKSDPTPESEDRIDNLQELVAALDEYAELNPLGSGDQRNVLAQFLEEVALVTDVDELNGDKAQVVLMTLHSAKGLEFSQVFMPGVEEGLFPHSRSMDEPAALEEERRLCYVGITRAKDRLHISAARRRTVFGEPYFPELSRFVAEVPPELLELNPDSSDWTPEIGSQESVSDVDGVDYGAFDDLPPPEGSRTPTPCSLESTPLAEPSEAQGPFVTGMRVRHRLFGIGEVITTAGVGAQQKVTIEFPDAGRKVVVARFVEGI